MQIKQIDVLVHPDCFQMKLPELSFHKRQLDLRERWESRVDLLKDRVDAMLFYFSNIPNSALDQGLKDISTVSNSIRHDDIDRIQRFSNKLGKRLIVYSWFAIINVDELKGIFESRGFTYSPRDTKIHAYGEVLGLCVKSYGDHVAASLGIPFSNIEYSPDESLTRENCAEIEQWRWNKFMGWI